MNVRLNEQRGPVGVDAYGEEDRRQLHRPSAHLGRLLGDRDGVHVHQAEVALVRVLSGRPVPQGPDVVAELDLAARLDPGEHARHEPGTYHRVRKVPPFFPTAAPFDC